MSAKLPQNRKNFYYCTDAQGKCPWIAYTATPPKHAPRWVQYKNDKPVRVSPLYTSDRVWDYSQSKFINITGSLV